jgi:hypothetical protein
MKDMHSFKGRKIVYTRQHGPPSSQSPSVCNLDACVRAQNARGRKTDNIQLVCVPSQTHIMKTSYVQPIPIRIPDKPCHHYSFTIHGCSITWVIVDRSSTSRSSIF